MLAALLKDHHFVARAFRALAHRLVEPASPYTNDDLEMLLLVTLALDRAGLWRPGKPFGLSRTRKGEA